MAKKKKDQTLGSQLLLHRSLWLRPEVWNILLKGLFVCLFKKKKVVILNEFHVSA